MGCTSSKADDLPAVALCRDRCNFLDEAIRQRYALAEAHVAYISSLKEIGLSLDRFFGQDLGYSDSPPSPFLPLPTQKKGDHVTAVRSASPPHVVGYHSHSNSGSHLHFHSETDEDDVADSGSLNHHHSDNSSPLHFHHDHETLASFSSGFLNMNYMRNRATPSVVYEQKPMSPKSVKMGESSYYPNNYPNPDNPSSYSYYADNSSYGSYGFFGSLPSYGSSPPPPARATAAQASSSSSKPPPPPPSPPRASAWDFLNPFEMVEKYYPSNTNTPSRNSKELREEEGIPDLEDENYQDEVVKEVNGNQKFKDGGGNYSKMPMVEDDRQNHGEALYKARPSGPDQNNGVEEYDVHLVDKKVVANEERGNVAAFNVQGGSRGASEIIREIKAQFERASEAGNEVSKMLEAGKIPYLRKNAVYEVSSKMLHSVTPSMSVVSSQPSTSKSTESSSSTDKVDSVDLDFDGDVGMRSGNLSSTLQKLHIWEKKLYDEVKAEEKMRISHERKCRRLKRMDEKGAEAHKVDTARTLVRSLSTKIRIAIQVVDKISIKISKLRDEELWPQISELISGLIIMWKVMLECHRNQCQAIAEAKSLDFIASNRKISDAHIQVSIQLERELQKWVLNFCSWVGAQKSFIKALNGWLLKCLLYEPEETPDGIAPFSPGRIGAPPLFVICNQWSQAMERISEKEVVIAMRGFALGIFQLWDRQSLELCQRMIAQKDAENNVKALDREKQKMQKEWQAIDKKIDLICGLGGGVSIPGQIVHQSGATNISSLQSGLKQIFEAMQRFSANSMQAYEELKASSVQDRLA